MRAPNREPLIPILPHMPYRSYPLSIIFCIIECHNISPVWLLDIRYSVMEFKSNFLFTVEGGVFEIEEDQVCVRSNEYVLTFESNISIVPSSLLFPSALLLLQGMTSSINWVISLQLGETEEGFELEDFKLKPRPVLFDRISLPLTDLLQNRSGETFDRFLQSVVIAQVFILQALEPIRQYSVCDFVSKVLDLLNCPFARNWKDSLSTKTFWGEGAIRGRHFSSRHVCRDGYGVI